MYDVGFVSQKENQVGKSNIRNRNHAHIRNRTHTKPFRVTKPYPKKIKEMAVYNCDVNHLSMKSPNMQKLALRVRKRVRIHVLPRGVGKGCFS